MCSFGKGCAGQRVLKVESLLPSKLSVFDFFTQFVSGTLLLSWGYCVILKISPFSLCPLQTLFFVVFSYLIGLIYFKIVDYISNIIHRKICCSGIDSEEGKLQCAAIPKKCCSNKKSICHFFCTALFCKNCPIDTYSSEISNKPKNGCQCSDYYTAYYRVMKAGFLDPVPVLEQQVAFIKSMLLIILLYGAYLPEQFTASCKGGFCPYRLALAFALFVSCLFVENCIQNKIYSHIWEADEYLKMIENTHCTKSTKSINKNQKIKQ